jgi:iron-sulfur cluster assembly protein
MAITLTPDAAEQVLGAFKKQNAPAGACLRIGVKGGGCSGFTYVMDIAPRPAEDDMVFDSGGVRIVCDPKSYLYLNGTEVDYDDALLGGGFVFNNPNAKGRCMCGASFRT